MNLITLLPKHEDYIFDFDNQVEHLEGTTGSSKTVIAITKYMLKVANTPPNKNQFLIGGLDINAIERNIIDSPIGILNQFAPLVIYKQAGRGGPRVEFSTDNGKKIIYCCGYNNKTRWKKVLGGTLHGFFIDEINIADTEFIGEIFTRLFRDDGFLITTCNGDDPNLMIFKRYLNRCRPHQDYIEDVPASTMIEMEESEPQDRWRFWFFNFRDNPTMTEKQIELLYQVHPPGTWQYQCKILGIRGIAEGLVYNLDKIETVDEVTNEQIICLDISIDTGYMQSATAATIYGIGSKQTIYALDTYYFKPNIKKGIYKAPSDFAVDLYEFVKETAFKYGTNIDMWTIDSAEGALRTEFHKIYGIWLHAVKKKQKKAMIDYAQAVLYSGKFKVVKTDNNMKYWLPEHKNYKWNDVDNDIKEDKDNPQPFKKKDHTCDNFQYYVIDNQRKLGFKF